MKLLSLLIAIFTFSSATLAESLELQNHPVTNINICQIEETKYGFRMDLANTILKRTAKQYGEARLTPYRHDGITISQNRCLVLLDQSKIDLLYLPPKPELLDHFDYIPFDMHAGMLGYRVFLINAKDKERFAKVNSIEDLRGFKGGFGSQWSDYKIFGLNDLPVVGAANTKVLMSMLKLGRFDYFHRGLHEAWKELEIEADSNSELMVEEHLALRYPFQVFFWFNKDNPTLKKRFETGLFLVLQDGSYHKLFRQYFEEIVAKAKLDQRTIIDIEYPISDEVGPLFSNVEHQPFWIQEF